MLTLYPAHLIAGLTVYEDDTIQRSFTRCRTNPASVPIRRPISRC